MKVPSRMVVLENIAPKSPGKSQIETVSVQYIGNTSDYFRDTRVPEIASSDYRDLPVSLLGARQAVNLARFAGGQQDAPQELQQAEEDLLAAEKALRFDQPLAEVDVLARKATSSGARAEEMALSRRAARLRREDTQRRDDALRVAEKSADSAQREIQQLRTALDREQRARESAEREAETANQQLREQRSEAKAFLRAFGRATHLMFEQRDQAKSILRKYAKIDDPGMLEGSLKYAQDFTEKIPLVKREGVQVVLDQEIAKNPPAKEFTPERFYDNSLVQELIHEGFYKSLWSK